MKRELAWSESNVIIKPGDIIDMRDSELVETKSGIKNVRIVIRSRNKKNSVAIFAEPKERDILVGRITNIWAVNHHRKYNPARRNHWDYTDLYVDIEDAFGETPNLVSELTRPEFITETPKVEGESSFAFGEKKDAKKEEG